MGPLAVAGGRAPADPAAARALVARSPRRPRRAGAGFRARAPSARGGPGRVLPRSVLPGGPLFHPPPSARARRRRRPPHHALLLQPVPLWRAMGEGRAPRVARGRRTTRGRGRGPAVRGLAL